MPALSPLTQFGGKPRDLKICHVAGGAAGPLAAPAGSFAVGDEIISISRYTTATFAPGTDLTQEFVTAMKGTGTVQTADTIDNTGGTATTGQLLVVLYATRNKRA